MHLLSLETRINDNFQQIPSSDHLLCQDDIALPIVNMLFLFALPLQSYPIRESHKDPRYRHSVLVAHTHIENNYQQSLHL